MPIHLPTLNSRTFESLLENLPIGVVAHAPDGLIFWANESVLDQLGVGREALVGAEIETLPLEGFSADRDDGSSYRVVSERDGAARRLRVTSVEVDDGVGARLTLRFFSEPRRGSGSVSSLAAAIALQPTVAMMDAESGTLHRHAVMQALQSEVTRSRRYGNPLTVALIWVNVTGDDGTGTSRLAAMAMVGRVLKEQTRWADNIGRWSDDQFLLVLPETRSHASAVLVEKIKDAAVSADDTLVLRFGLADWHPGDDTTLLIERAEAAGDSHLRLAYAGS